MSTDLEKVVEGDLVSTKQLESSKEEFAQISKVGIVEKSLEADIQKEENPAGEKVVVTSDETSSWALVSPAKMGRSPAKDQTEVLHISASKFTVLSVEEEREDGEIPHESHQCANEEAHLSKVSTDVGSEAVDEGITIAKVVEEQSSMVQEVDEQSEPSTTRGSRRKKAKSQKATSVTMSTRSSLRH